MTGGLINLVSYGADDLYLTGAPEITFFKFVYRRHTNFSKESVIIPLDGLAFGNTIEVEILKVGDLISNTYLQIDFPEVHILKSDMVTDMSEEDIILLNKPDDINKPFQVDDYKNIITPYMKLNLVGYKTATTQVNIKNQSVNEYLENIVASIINVPNSSTIINSYKIAIQNAFNYEINNEDYVLASNLNFYFSDIVYACSYILDIMNGTQPLPENGTVFGFIDPFNTNIQQIYFLIEKLVKQCQNIMNYYFEYAKKYDESVIDVNSLYAKFAWIERFGHAIIDYIEIKIGGEIIDKHYSDWMNIWYELSSYEKQKNLYNKMIGNIKEMITFDKEAKPKYTVYIPLLFWFCINNGLAFPLIPLQFNKFYINIALKNVEDCAYIQTLPDKTDIYDNVVNYMNNALSLTDIFDNLNLFITGNLLVDYIYLDTKERKRFAQSAHEYLINTVELTNYENLESSKQVLDLDFTGPSKEIIFVCQKEVYVNNNTTETNKSNIKCMPFNYTTSAHNGKNPIYNTALKFNGYDRFAVDDNMQLNFLRPYVHHTRTPSNGINIYSFSLSPEQHQPSGTCNFTRISYPLLHLSINDEMFYYMKSDINPSIIPNSLDDSQEQTSVNLRIYSIKTNILRVMHGFGAIAFY